jgi:6-phosphogluconolactonase (cycloisomerase 2 family)
LNNGGDILPLTASGTFAFATPVASGGHYSVSISTQPIGLVCTVSNGSGTVGAAAVSNVNVSCTTQFGKFLYVANSGSNDISSYSIDAATGALTSLGAPVPAGVKPQFVTIDPAEKFVYVTDAGSLSSAAGLSAYSINGTTGALTQVAGSPFALAAAASSTPHSLTPPVIDPETKFVYLGDRTDKTIYGARIDSGTGGLTAMTGVPPLAIGQNLGYPILDKTGKYLYVPYMQSPSGGAITGFVSGFRLDAANGTLTAAAGALPTNGDISIIAQRDPSGKFLLVSNQNVSDGSGSVAVFSIDASTGTLTAVPGSPFSTGLPALGLSFHPTKDFVFVTTAPASGTGNGSLVIFRIDPTTGVLASTGAPEATVGSDPSFPLVEPTGKFLIIPNRVSNTIQSFSIDQMNGALTEVAGSPLATDAGPLALRPDLSWKYFFGVNATANTLSSYRLDSTTGALTLVNSLPTGTNPIFAGLAGRQ